MSAPVLVSLGKATGTIRRLALCAAACCLLLAATATRTAAQSQALNGQIEGAVTDSNGAAIPNASVTATNIETGAERKVTSDEDGIYRVPLLPLGAYRVTAEAPNFKRLVREGITITTGQTATVPLTLEAGEVSEVITITGDALIADPGKIDVGRVMNSVEVQNLPLVSRNPYNFALLQANVTGRPNVEFGVPRINANGYTRRTNYQLDGNNNTQTDRSGIRLMPISEVFVSEVQLVTNGFSPEFGNTTGLIMNAVTRAGTNDFHGHAGYRFRRTSFSSRPFFSNPLLPKPETKVDDYTVAVGGPILRDRWHFYTGFEDVARDLAGEPQRVVTVTQANQQALVAAGVSQEAFPNSIPAAQKVRFFIVRTDVQIGDAHHLVGRVNTFRNNSPNNIGGGLTTLERSIDFIDQSDSVGVQFASTFSPTLLNELRYQYSRRYSQNLPNDNSGSGPTVVITGIANFGSPENANTIAPLEKSNQLLDNVTFTRGAHAMKFGAGFNVIDDTQKSGVFARYTFPSIAAYVAARNGTTPRGYTNYVESFGQPEISYGSVFYHWFAQDDWKVTQRLKVNYGLRYDLYDIPNADESAPLDLSRDFRVDKNNFAPRLGIVYALREGDRPTVVRASGGIYYDPPQIDIYRRAIQNNGSPTFVNFTFNPSTQGAPSFPNTLGSLPAGAALPRQSVEAVADDFANLYAFHTNAQVEQALTGDLSVTVGLIYSKGTRLPIYRNINPINPVGQLADGRPIFSSTVNAGTRLFPQFNNVLLVESVGNSNYTAGTLQLNKRLSNGYQFSVNYTLSHAIDDAPEQNLVATQFTNLVLSDPTNRQRDRGNALADQRHTFVVSFVGRPKFQLENTFVRRLVNDNQVGFIVTANSGEAFNIVSQRDLNNDGFGAGSSDRPLFVGRNTGRTPNQFNVDMRYSRFVTITERFNVEVFGEFLNLFNRNSIFQVNGVIATDVNGNLSAPLPDFTRQNPVALDSRQFQLGFKFNF
ncbi:MAG: TonB-dependent receptor domain-containing protein [Pyrinomonadaceae bacterium]